MLGDSGKVAICILYGESMALLIWNIPFSDSPNDEIAKRLKLKVDAITSVVLLKRSVDARRRPPVWMANYKVTLNVSEQEILRKKLHGVREFTQRDQKRYQKVDFNFNVRPKFPAHIKPIVIGAGPAGLFAALRLAEAGAKPLLFERGGKVKERHYAVRDFWRKSILNPENKGVFGEGGAGAFSDGKIYTRRRDGELGWVFQRLVDFGADPAILEEGWAHLGTDKIREILPQIRAYIEEMGGVLRFNTKVEELIVDDGRCAGVRLAGGEEVIGAPVIVATGHSARDSWRMLLRAGAQAQLRPIRIGARVEHPQKLIDRGLYGDERKELPPASYRFVSKPRDSQIRGAHTFCMCPGGTVVGATSEADRVVVNGMSYSGRRAFWANSAIIVDVRLDDYTKQDPWSGILFQDKIEQAAFIAGGGGFKAPAQRVADFLAKRDSLSLARTSFPNGVSPYNLWELFPSFIAEGMAEALRFFNRKIPGFAGEEGVLIAPETRTSAPLRFDRDSKMVSTTLKGLMPIGEGAGYAGGIASAALEGFRAAQLIAEEYLT